MSTQPVGPTAADSHPQGLNAVLPFHVAAIVLLQSTLNAAMAIMPVLALRRFGANEWQSVFITSAPSVLAVFSIFWNAAFSRMSLRSYLWLYWAVALLPMGLIALVQNFWQLVMLYVVSAVGNAGWTPAYGDLLRRFYPDSIRGRAFSVLFAFSLFGGTAGGYAVGAVLNTNHNAFRFYLPLAAALQVGGIALLLWLARRCGVDPQSAPETRTRQSGTWRTLYAPILHMREILSSDRIFARYEAAFMTYGVGWMICFALLPLLVTHKLNMDYRQVAASTLVAQQLSMLIASFVAGWANDRVGAARTSSISFALVALYPIGLMLSASARDIGMVSVLYGIAMAGVNVGWMIGPVTIAPSRDKVPQYMAIHTTLVGLRGILFQWLGMLLYMWTGSFAWPLAVASAGFAGAAVQMWSLRRAFGAKGVIRRTTDVPTPNSGQALDAEARPNATEMPTQSPQTEDSTRQRRTLEPSGYRR